MPNARRAAHDQDARRSRAPDSGGWRAGAGTTAARGGGMIAVCCGIGRGGSMGRTGARWRPARHRRRPRRAPAGGRGRPTGTAGHGRSARGAHRSRAPKCRGLARPAGAAGPAARAVAPGEPGVAAVRRGRPARSRGRRRAVCAGVGCAGSPSAWRRRRGPRLRRRPRLRRALRGRQAARRASRALRAGCRGASVPGAAAPPASVPGAARTAGLGAGLAACARLGGGLRRARLASRRAAPGFAAPWPAAVCAAAARPPARLLVLGRRALRHRRCRRPGRASPAGGCRAGAGCGRHGWDPGAAAGCAGCPGCGPAAGFGGCGCACTRPGTTAGAPGLRGALRRPARPFAQALHVPRLREVENREDGEPDHGGEAGVRADFLDDFRQGLEL